MGFVCSAQTPPSVFCAIVFLADRKQVDEKNTEAPYE